MADYHGCALVNEGQVSHASAACGRPHFLGIGAQKAGTTTLFKLLASHAEISVPRKKEVHYFTLNYCRGIDWYSGCFDWSDSVGRLRGEVTPYYLYHPFALERIRRDLPGVKLLVLLRDPVERCLSQYFHSFRLGLETLPLAQALDAESVRLASCLDVLRAADGVHRSHQEHSYLSRSRYDEQLIRLKSLFPDHQLLIRRSEDFFAEPRRLLRDVAEFLGIADCWPDDAAASFNAGRGESRGVDDGLRREIRARLAPAYDYMERFHAMTWRP